MRLRIRECYWGIWNKKVLWKPRTPAIGGKLPCENWAGTARGRSSHCVNELLLCFGQWELSARDALVKKSSHHNAAVLSLSFGSLVAADLSALAHRARRQHVGQRDATLLYQDVGHIVGPVFAQLLIQSDAAYGRG